MLNRKFHILIVDDVVDNIQVAMNILKQDDYHLSFAMGGGEAIRLVESDPNTFDLILLDIMMPSISGYDVCTRLKSNPSTTNIPIIFVTAKTDIASISKGFASGSVDYIVKPFHAEELLARVQTHVMLAHSKKLLMQHNISLENEVVDTKQHLQDEMEEAQREMVYVLIDLLALNSEETAQHVRRMAEVSYLLGKLHPKVSKQDAQVLRDAAPMHDVGKMTVPEHILHKAGKYTQEEYAIMKNHAQAGYDILAKSQRSIMKAAALIAHQHHEKWDGSGYPQGLKGEEIHIFGRIVAIADVFDALVNKRSYKDAWSFEDALSYIESNKGTHFDPELVELFKENYDKFKRICLSFRQEANNPKN